MLSSATRSGNATCNILSVSVVIPTCNRKKRLLALLQNLALSTYPLLEIIIIDSSDEILPTSELEPLNCLNIKYLTSEKSVCSQRNRGINMAKGSWIFLCDDDIQIPNNYIEKLVRHANAEPKAGAVSGLILQKANAKWTYKYSVKSPRSLLWKYLFQLSVWGDIDCKKDNWLTKKITGIYKRKGNHLSKAGWPVITDFSGNYFTSPLYGLGASLIRKEWLMLSPYDEVLDHHGIGDNFGVAAGFPEKIHVLTNTFAYHFEESENRLSKPLQYYRRVLALDYFRRTKKNLSIKKSWLLWSLLGNLISFLRAKDKKLSIATLKAGLQIFIGKNPYYAIHKNAKNKQAVIKN